MPNANQVRLYEGDAELLLSADHFPDRVSLLPGSGGKLQPGQRLRILWGQDMLRDILDGRYRTVVCGVNDSDNSHGIIAALRACDHQPVVGPKRDQLCQALPGERQRPRGS